MVQGIALALFGGTTGISAFGIGLTTATGALTIAGTIVNGVLLHAVSSALQKNPSSPTPDDLQTNSKTTTGERVIHFGTVKVGGVHAFHRGYQGISHRIVVMGESVTSIDNVYLDREIVTIDTGGDVTSKYTLNGSARVTVDTRLGAMPETHYSQITSVWPEWTAEHRLDGLCTAYVQSRSTAAEHQHATFPNGEPEVLVAVKGAEVFDPRDGQMKWSDNAALVINQFASMEAGLNDPDFFDEASIIAEANACDELNDVVGGGAEPRWRLNGTFSRAQRPQDVLRDMMASCGARMKLQSNGKMALRMPRDIEPTVTITDDDIIQFLEHNPGPDLLDRFNQASATYTEPDLDYSSTTSNIYTSPDLLAKYGRAERSEVKTLPFCPSNRQAQDALKTDMLRKNAEHIVSVRCNLGGFEASGEFEIYLDAPLFGYEGKYEVISSSYMIDDGFFVAVDLQLRKMSEASYGPITVAEQGERQELPVNSQSDGVPIPAGVAASGSGVEVSGGTFVAGIYVVWDAPVSDNLTPVVKYTGVLVEPSSPTVAAVGDGATSATITGLQDGADYDVQVYFVSADGTPGPAVNVQNITAKASVTPPEPPTGLVVSDVGGGSARVDMMASTSTDLRKTQVFRDGALVSTIYTGPDSKISFTDTCGSGSFSWTARSVNVSAISSTTDAGPVTQTIL